MSYNFPEEYVKREGQHNNTIKNEHDGDQEVSEEVKAMLNSIVEKE